MEFVLLVISFAVILAGALLFTNAIEWVGHKVGLGEGAVGSLLAAVGTALPETLIAIVALVGATKSEDIAIGAIVGAPFLLATLAMGLVGGTAYIYRSRRKQDINLEVHVPTLDRDLAFFMVFFGLALALGFGAPEELRLPAGIVFFLAYVVYVAFTIRGSGEVQSEESLNSLILARGPKAATDPPLSVAILQVLVGLAAMVGGAHLFVEELLHFAEEIGVEAIVLSLILAPARHRAPREGQQLLLGPRGQGLARPRQHHGRDGLPVDHPRRDRPDVHGLGAERQRGGLGRPRPRRRPDRLLGPAPARPLRAAGDHRLAWAVRGIHRRRRGLRRPALRRLHAGRVRALEGPAAVVVRPVAG